MTRANIGTGPLGSLSSVTSADVAKLQAGIHEKMMQMGGPALDENHEEREEYELYVARAQERMRQIELAQQVK